MIEVNMDLLLSAEAKQQKAAEEKLIAAIEEAQAYLAATDWYATRLSETGEAIPEEISAKRAAARALLSSD